MYTTKETFIPEHAANIGTQHIPCSVWIPVWLAVCAWCLEFLEVLNLYNCKAWWCSGVPFIYFGVSGIIYFFICREHCIMIPTLVASFIGGVSLLFWDCTRWNIDTRHRTEYYDTHNFYANALWLNCFWNFVYVLVIKRWENERQNPTKVDSFENLQLP